VQTLPYIKHREAARPLYRGAILRNFNYLAWESLIKADGQVTFPAFQNGGKFLRGRAFGFFHDVFSS
jgi:hypothetical protein